MFQVCLLGRATKNKGFCDSILYYWISLGTEHRILHEEADNPVIRTDGTGLLRKSQQWTGSSVERMAGGRPKLKVVHSARRMEAMSLITIMKDPVDETNLDDDEIEVKEPLGL